MQDKKKKFWYSCNNIKYDLFFFFMSKKTRKREYFRYQKYYEKYYGYPSKKSYKSFCALMIWKAFCAWIFVLTFPITMWCHITVTISFYTVQHWPPLEERILLEKELKNLWRKEDEAEKQKKMLEKKK